MACLIAVRCRLAAVPLLDTRVVTGPGQIGEPRRISWCNPEATARIEDFLHRGKRILNNPVTSEYQHHRASLT